MTEYEEVLQGPLLQVEAPQMMKSLLHKGCWCGLQWVMWFRQWLPPFSDIPGAKVDASLHVILTKTRIK